MSQVDPITSEQKGQDLNMTHVMHRNHARFKSNP